MKEAAADGALVGGAEDDRARQALFDGEVPLVNVRVGELRCVADDQEREDEALRSGDRTGDGRRNHPTR